ncbi:Putative uncharacterized protein [Halomonas sp. R57-5]|nr:Putative uncharacterized protein [Halomonas sp. R57-5]
MAHDYAKSTVTLFRCKHIAQDGELSVLDQIVRYVKGTWLKRISVVNHHHGVLIVVIGFEAATKGADRPMQGRFC